MRIGFIGGWGHHYLRFGLAPDDAVAVAGDGHDAEAALRLGRSLPDAATFDDAATLIERFKPDVVSVGAVYGFNGDVVADVLERDVPVISDKPIAASWRQLNRIETLAGQQPRRVVLTEFPFRAQPEFRAARDAVAAGRVGETVLVTAQKSYKFGARPAWYGDRTSYGGTLLWVASHMIDALGFVTGRRPVRACGRGANVSKPQFGAAMEDHLAITFELDNGATAVVHADFLRPAAAATHGDDRLRVAGASGVVEVRADRCTLTTAEQAETELGAGGEGKAAVAAALRAALGGDAENYSTGHSLAAARTLLKSRDALDAGGNWTTM